MPRSPSARSTTLSWRTSALSRELWNGNSGQGASQVCHRRPGAAELDHLGGGGEVAVHGLLRRRQLVRGDDAGHHAPAVDVPALLELGCEERRHPADDSAGVAGGSPLTVGSPGVDVLSDRSKQSIRTAWAGRERDRRSDARCRRDPGDPGGTGAGRRRCPDRGGLRRGERTGDRPAGRVQSEPRLLPLRLGGQPAARRAGRGERERRVRYQAAVDRADGIGELVGAAAAIFEEDLDAGHIAVLAEMIAGASSTPGLAGEVAARIAPWRRFTAEALAEPRALTVGGAGRARRGRPCRRCALPRARAVGAPRRGSRAGPRPVRQGRRARRPGGGARGPPAQGAPQRKEET